MAAPWPISALGLYSLAPARWGGLVDSSKGYWRLSLEGPLNGGTPPQGPAPGGLGHAGEPEHAPGTNPRGRGVRPSRRPGQQRGAKLTAPTAKASGEQSRCRSPGGPPKAAALLPTCSVPGLRCVFTGEFHHPSGPSVLHCETGTLTKTSFSERMDTYSMVHADHRMLLSTKQK